MPGQARFLPGVRTNINLKLENMKKSELVGLAVRIKTDIMEIGGNEILIEDYWMNVAGKSWMDCDNNPACLQYAMRAGLTGLPTDNNVLYGKIGWLGFLVHVNEIEDLTTNNQ
ncbi:hypothetical protein LCGC14_2340500 [marine sediment metagenome]|uniref:Uncharacterized protein n=1 Tax=marine sediment metagenome TaxID=412755 RepID=A0A0F9CCY7_9ZZZZ